MACTRRSSLLALFFLLAVIACGGGGGGDTTGGGGEVLQTAFTPQLAARAGDTSLVLEPVAEDNLLLDVIVAGRLTPPGDDPVEVSAAPGAHAASGWWGLLAVDGTGASRVVAEAVGRPSRLTGRLPADLDGEPLTLLLVRARTGAEIRAARHTDPRRTEAASIGGKIGEYVGDRIKDAIGLIHQPWEILDDLYDDTQDKVVNIYSDLLDSLIDPVLTDSDYFAETLDHWLTTSLSTDPLHRGPLTDEQTPVIFVHGITFRYPIIDPGEELDDLMVMIADQVPDWDARYHAMRFEYNPFGPVGESADELVEALVNDLHLPTGRPIVLVSYSLGGIVSRAFDTRYGDLYPVSRLIMIGTPSGGAPMDEIRDIILDRAYDLGNVAEVTVPFGLFARTVVQVGWARTYGSAASLDDIEVGSPFLARLVPPRDGYSAIAGVEVGGNLLLRRIRRVYKGAPNDGVVSVASVEAGLVSGADAKITYPDGHRDYVASSHGDLADSPVVAAEIARILGQPLP